MSAERYAYVEQDQDQPAGGNELPTYDDLATQNGPNSRQVSAYRSINLTQGNCGIGLGAGKGGSRRGAYDISCQCSHL
jgi:hypothetical protein